MSIFDKKRIRALFRQKVFERAKYCCEICGVSGYDRQGSGKGVPLDAHHITNRKEMPNGGYVPENGISVCDSCHKKAEKSEPAYEPERLYGIIGSSEEKAKSVSQSKFT